jgi:Family of unknown function (DUF6603)
MAGAEDTIDAIVEEIEAALGPLTDALDSPAGFTRLMARLGWRVDALIGAAEDLKPLLAQNTESVAQSENGTGDSASSLGQVGQLFGAIRGLSSMPSAGLPATIDATAFKSEFPRQIIDYLLVEHLLERRPRIGRVLQLLGVIRLVPTPAAGTRLEYMRREVAWEDLANLLSDPLPIFSNAYHWGQSDFDGLQLLRVVTALGQAYNLSTELGTMESAAQTAFSQAATVPLRAESKEAIARFQFIQNRHLDPGLEAGIGVVLLPETSSAQPGFAVVPYARGTSSVDFGIVPNVEGFVRAEASLTGGIGLMVRPDQVPKLEIGFLGGPTAASAKLGAGIAVSRPESPIVLLGQGGGSRLEAQSLSVGGGVRIQTGTTPTAFVEARAKSLALVIKPSPEEADGFLAKILPTDMRAEFDLTAGLESQRGFYFEGGGGLEIKLPVHIELGPLEIQGALIGIKPVTRAIAVDLAATLKVDVSVLKGVVENVGLRLLLKAPPGGGQLGPFDIELGFRPPNGVGLSIDAGVVKGGGYLYFDFDREEYAGALELNFADFLDLKAIGLVTTRMPDGSKGFSLLIIITAEFSPGFQLGYGFKLIGVGGLLGLNRTMVLEALALGVRTGAVNGILFPVDPVANAPRIISDLRTIFPPSLNRFLIGPMAKLGWGTPTLVSLELGIIIEIPGNIAILGVLRLAIAGDDGDSILQLQVNFIGAIEFDKKRGWFFAALFDSRLLTITIEGEMGLLIAVGDEPNFLMSNGGFHPLFHPVPPLPFPTPKRLAFDIINTDYARIRAEAYFAITTNTVQFGARAQLYFGFSAFSVDGYFAFDALMRFSPPYLLVEVSAGATLKIGGAGVFTVDLGLSLEGPTPWRARGHASVNVLFIKVTKEFDETFGQVVAVTLQPIAVVQLLLDELAKASNWRALAAPASNLGVSLRTLNLPADTLVLHPLGTLEISQNAVPLGITLEKVGEQIPSDANRLALALKGGDLVKRRDATRGFAPAQFRKLSDSQKLSAPAFQNEVSGLELGVAGQELRTGRAVKRSMRYEVTTLDTLYRRLVRRFSAQGRELFAHFIAGASVSKVAVSKSRRQELQPFGDGVVVADEPYSVVFTSDNSPAGVVDFASEAAATEWIQDAAMNDPRLHGQLQVVPSSERRAAA